MDKTEDLKFCLKQMLGWFNDFCEKNSLCYYALGGTLLGAMRHGGFIPWDDDVDVGMPRPDYERFEELMNEEHDRYVIETPECSGEDYCYPFIKLYNTETTLIEKRKNKVKRGIFIDITPIDGIGNTFKESLNNFRFLSILLDLYAASTVEINKNRKIYKNAAALLMKFIPRFIINNKKFLLKISNLCKRYDYDSYEYSGNLVGIYRSREIVSKKVFGKPIKLKFEDTEINAPEDSESYLTNIYGDWRTLPPIEKRTSHHDFLELNLSESYLDSN